MFPKPHENVVKNTLTNFGFLFIKMFLLPLEDNEFYPWKTLKLHTTDKSIGCAKIQVNTLSP